MSSIGSQEVQPAARGVPALPGLIVVVPSPTGIPPTQIIAGVPLLRRIVLAAAAAGYTEILVRGQGEPVAGLLEGTDATLLTADALQRRAPARVVVLAGNVVPDPRWLRVLLEMPLVREHVCVDSSMVAVVETADPAKIVELVMRGDDAATVMADLRRAFVETRSTLDPEGRFEVTAPPDVARAESWLFRGLIKQREGFMSRHFERRISMAVTRRLAATAITPNAMTLVSAGIGLASAPCFLSSAPSWQLLGAVGMLTHSILDGCDGELARLKFLQSRFGAALDFWSDNVVHVAIFSAMAVGWSLASGSMWPLLVGVVAVLVTLGAAAVLFRRTAEDRAAAAWVLDVLASRDFVYALIVMAIFGKAAWFIVAVAVGTPVFVALTLWLGAVHGRVR